MSDAERDRLVGEVDRLTGCVSKLIGDRIVEDGEGRGWWAYAEPPEDQHGFAEPVLCPSLEEAFDAVCKASRLEYTR